MVSASLEPMMRYLVGVTWMVLGAAACGGVVRRGDGHADANGSGGKLGSDVPKNDDLVTGDHGGEPGQDVTDEPASAAGELEIRMSRPMVDVAIDSAHFVVKSFDESVLAEGNARVTNQGEQLSMLLRLNIVGGATVQFDTTGAGAGTCHGALGPFDIVEGQRATYLIKLLECQPD